MSGERLTGNGPTIMQVNAVRRVRIADVARSDPMRSCNRVRGHRPCSQGKARVANTDGKRWSLSRTGTVHRYELDYLALGPCGLQGRAVAPTKTEG
jgi:hypothetical protein